MPEGNQKERLERWKAETERNPDSAHAHFNLGLVYTERGMMTSAENAYRKALELEPELIEGWVNLGGVLLMQWRFEEALAATEEALGRAPESVMAHFNNGQAHLYLGHAEQVVACNRRVLELDGNHAAAHYFLAVGLLATDRPAEARAELSQAVRLGHRPTAEFLRTLERAEQSLQREQTRVPIIEIGGDKPQE